MRARGLKKPQNDLFALPFGYFPHSLLKRQKTFRIARQLVSSSSIRLARIKTLVNDHPRMKLGSDKPVYAGDGYVEY